MSPYIIPGLSKRNQCPDKILEAVSKIFGVPGEVIIRGTNSSEKARARVAFVWYLRKVLKWRVVETAKYFRREFKSFIDHTTIARCTDEGIRLMSDDTLFKHNIEQVKRVMLELPASPYTPVENPVIQVTFEPDWLEKFIINYFQLQENAFSSKSHFAKDRLLRHVSLAAFAAYSGMKLKDIAKRFGIYYNTLWGYIKQGMATEEYRRINAELKGYSFREANRSPFGIAR